MKKPFKQAIEHRRSYYAISELSPITDKEIEDIVKFAIKNVPSAFNSQSTRVVLLFGDNHKKLWDITLESLRKIVPESAFAPTKSKIDSFAAGHGTALFYEDQNCVQSLQQQFPLYADNFPVWSEQTSAMHQFAIWTMLEDSGLGASLQHYNTLIESQLTDTFRLPNSWKLIAQMPFGTPTAEPAEKTFTPIEERVLVF